MRRPRRLRLDAPELNLVPLLDMVSLLIQMLLVDAQFGVYAEVASAVSAGTAEATGEQLGLAVRVAPDGFRVQWIEGGEGRERPLLCDPAPCADLAAWDGDGLRSMLLALKDAHPEERAVVLLPEPGVPFEAVVRAMDVARDDGAGQPLFPDLVVGP
jgi:biopolymer transport protein ExbD